MRNVARDQIDRRKTEGGSRAPCTRPLAPSERQAGTDGHDAEVGANITKQGRRTDSQTITNSIGMKLVLIPAGEFLMGSPDSDKDAEDDEKPQHRVRITRPFYLGGHEVTQGQYRRSSARTRVTSEDRTTCRWRRSRGTTRWRSATS